MNEALLQAVLQLGDDSLVLSQRLCEWSGHAPTIEVDLSLSNLALDLLGQATLLLDYAGEIEGQGRTADRLAFHRNAEAFRNSLLVEQPNGDFAHTVARQFLFSTYSAALFGHLTRSRDARLAQIAAKAIKEVRYHASFARDWIVRLGDGTDESRARMIDGLEWMARFADDLFAWGNGAQALVAEGVLPAPNLIREEFDSAVEAALAQADLVLPNAGRPITGGRAGRHSEHLSPMLAIMQVLPRAHPEAVW